MISPLSWPGAFRYLRHDHRQERYQYDSNSCIQVPFVVGIYALETAEITTNAVVQVFQTVQTLKALQHLCDSISMGVRARQMHVQRRAYH